MANSNEYSAALLLKGTPNVPIFFSGFYTGNCIPKIVLSVMVCGRFCYFNIVPAILCMTCVSQEYMLCIAI